MSEDVISIIYIIGRVMLISTIIGILKEGWMKLTKINLSHMS